MFVIEPLCSPDLRIRNLEKASNDDEDYFPPSRLLLRLISCLQCGKTPGLNRQLDSHKAQNVGMVGLLHHSFFLFVKNVLLCIVFLIIVKTLKYTLIK